MYSFSVASLSIPLWPSVQCSAQAWAKCTSLDSSRCVVYFGQQVKQGMNSNKSGLTIYSPLFSLPLTLILSKPFMFYARYACRKNTHLSAQPMTILWSVETRHQWLRVLRQGENLHQFMPAHIVIVNGSFIKNHHRSRNRPTPQSQISTVLEFCNLVDLPY